MRIAALMLSGLDFYPRAKVCFETWLNDFEEIQIHSFAPCEYLPITKVGRFDGVGSCFDKRHDGLRKAQSLNADWFLCCSDDNYIWRRHLESVLAMVDSPILMGGHAGERRLLDGSLVHFPSGGAGYCLNRSALDLVVKYLEELRNIWSRADNPLLEDVFMGWAAAELKIPFLMAPGFFGCNPLEGNCHSLAEALEHPAVSFHYVTPAQMRLLYNGRNTPAPNAIDPAPGA